MTLRTATLGLVLMFCGACQDADKPEEPVWDKQPCAQCHMVLSDPRYAAQVATKDSQRLFFDDIGCMAAYLADHEGAIAHAWVHTERAWQDAYSTRYATGASTPMGYGYSPAASGALDLRAIIGAVKQKSNGATP